MLSTADRDEKDQEIQVLSEIRKAMENLMHFVKKMQLEEKRMYMQMTEKQRSHVSSTEAVTNLMFRQVRSLPCFFFWPFFTSFAVFMTVLLFFSIYPYSSAL